MTFGENVFDGQWMKGFVCLSAYADAVHDRADTVRGVGSDDLIFDDRIQAQPTPFMSVSTKASNDD